MNLEPLTLGFIGCGLLVLLCVLGVRIAYAAAIVGAFGLAVLTGWGPGLAAAGSRCPAIRQSRSRTS